MTVQVLLAGDSRVGKSTLVGRLNEWFTWLSPSAYKETVGASLHVEVEGGVDYKIWDTAGAVGYRRLLPMYPTPSRGTVIAQRLVLVADVMRPETYTELDCILHTLLGPIDTASFEGANIADVVLVHNKTDLPGDDDVSGGGSAVRDAVSRRLPTARFLETRCGVKTSREDVRRILLTDVGVMLDRPRFMHGCVRLPSSLPSMLSHR